MRKKKKTYFRFRCKQTARYGKSRDEATPSVCYQLNKVNVKGMESGRVRYYCTAGNGMEPFVIQEVTKRLSATDVSDFMWTLKLRKMY